MKSLKVELASVAGGTQDAHDFVKIPPLLISYLHFSLDQFYPKVFLCEKEVTFISSKAIVST